MSDQDSKKTDQSNSPNKNQPDKNRQNQGGKKPDADSDSKSE